GPPPESPGLRRRTGRGLSLAHRRDPGRAGRPPARRSRRGRPRFALTPVRVGIRTPRAAAWVTVRRSRTKQGRREAARMVKSDIEIAREAKMLPIMEIGARLGIPADKLSPYGHTKAKLDLGYIAGLADRPDGKLILV